MCSRLAQHLAPASVDDIATFVANLHANFNAPALDDVPAKARGKGYLIALEGAPAFALEEAYGRLLRGTAGLSSTFMPTAPELRALIDKITLPARAHVTQLRRLLEAGVEREISDEERAAVAARFKTLLTPSQGPAQQ